DLLLPLLGLPGAHALGRLALRILARLGTDLGRDAEDLETVFEALPDPVSRRAFVRTLRAVVDWRGQHVTFLDRCYLARDVPTLFVWGSRDPIVPFDHAHIAHHAMPGSRLEIFDGAGHYPHHTDPARFLRTFRDFMSTTSPASYDEAAWRDLLCGGVDG